MSDHSPELDQLAAALVRVQAILPPARLDATAWVGRSGASASYHYATLNSVWDAIRKALPSNGLAISQTCELGGVGEARLTTWLLHTSGQWLCGTASVPAIWRGPRGYGSALTYARRYGLAAILGLCIDVDDDAATAGDVSEPASQGDAWPEYCPELRHRPSAVGHQPGLEPPDDVWRRRNGHGRTKSYRKQRQPPEPA